MTLVLSGCFLSQDEVAAQSKKCFDLGGQPYVLLTRDKRPLSAYCDIDGIRYAAGTY